MLRKLSIVQKQKDPVMRHTRTALIIPPRLSHPIRVEEINTSLAMRQSLVEGNVGAITWKDWHLPERRGKLHPPAPERPRRSSDARSRTTSRGDRQRDGCVPWSRNQRRRSRCPCTPAPPGRAPLRHGVGSLTPRKSRRDCSQGPSFPPRPCAALPLCHLPGSSRNRARHRSLSGGEARTGSLAGP